MFKEKSECTCVPFRELYFIPSRWFKQPFEIGSYQGYSGVVFRCTADSMVFYSTTVLETFILIRLPFLVLQMLLLLLIHTFSVLSSHLKKLR